MSFSYDPIPDSDIIRTTSNGSANVALAMSPDGQDALCYVLNYRDHLGFQHCVYMVNDDIRRIGSDLFRYVEMTAEQVDAAKEKIKRAEAELRANDGDVTDIE